MLRLRVRHLEFSVDGRSLSGRVRRDLAVRVVLAVRLDNVPGWLLGRDVRCIRRVRSRVGRVDRAVQGRDFQVVRGRALAPDRVLRVRFRLRVKRRRARGQVNGQVSGAAVSATRR
jgi:hypothetical protein